MPCMHLHFLILLLLQCIQELIIGTIRQIIQEDIIGAIKKCIQEHSSRPPLNKHRSSLPLMKHIMEPAKEILKEHSLRPKRTIGQAGRGTLGMRTMA